MRRALSAAAVILALCLAAAVWAQEKPTAVLAEQRTEQKQVAPMLDTQAQTTLAVLRQRLAAIEWAQAVFQREQDQALGELQRFAVQHQIVGYRLDLQTGSYVPMASPK